MGINFIDIIVLIPILWGGFKGFRNGLISEGGTILALLLGIWVSMKFSESFADVIQSQLALSNAYKQIVAFGIIFILVVIVVFFITKLLNNFFKAVSLEWLNKLLGIVFGATKFLIILAFIFFLIDTLVDRYSTKKVPAMENSLFFKPLSQTAGSVLDGNITIPEFKVPYINNENLLDGNIEE